ncbi:aminoglycoside phosphotransferase family protein [Paenibacillus sp. FSL H8-0317]|uniref:aminoglycoside phosphotransferase family protein n=1 Tax=Paenibacillus TaxID=44249 RepID=UPI001C8E1BE4|nr:aminoglycoside phosphotransferase family protein [Paenibacillus xylanexedens]MBY0118534.1 aminoglycoside phosphotransferase family protein [Paenibacillus xylanexedens]
MSTMNSGLHCTISAEMLHQLVEIHFGSDTKVKGFGLLQGGLFNTTYRIHLEHTSYTDVILRLAPERGEMAAGSAGDPLFSFERTMMAAEPIVYEYYRKAGIPAPNIIACDDSGSIIPRTYMFMAFIPSKQLDHVSISDIDKERLYHQLGVYTAIMHQIEGTSFGWPQGDGTIKGSDQWSEVLHSFAEETALKAAQADYMLGVGEEIAAIFIKNKDLFDQVTRPVLVHNDLWEANVLVHQEKGELNIAAIIDGDRSMFADREFEAILSTESVAFHEGYDRPLDSSIEGQARRLAYRILSSYFNAYVHEHQVNQPEDGQKYRQRTLDLLEQWKRLEYN